MSVELHEFHPEEVMAYLDGEITGERALALADHLEHCTDCSSLADDFCALSQQLIAWKVEPSALEQPDLEELGAVKVGMDSSAASQGDGTPVAVAAPRVSLLSLGGTWRPFVQRPWVWALASACAVMLIVSSVSLRMSKVAPSHSSPTRASNEASSSRFVGGDNSVNGIRAATSPEEMSKLQAEFQRAGKLPGAADAKLPDNLPANGRNYLNFTLTQPARDAAPSIGVVPTSGTNLGAAQMIERTASLSLTVKEMDAARTALEELAKQHHGYFAELNTVGQSDVGRTLSASLRVPAAELDATLAELRKLGQLGEEKQGGEEVSQQYVDLKARLDNARHTEKRLTDLLTKRAAKLKDVLDVERELAGTREEIERMEAQQRNMENQVHYASIDLKLREEYKPALNLAPPAAGTRMRNALVDGYHSAVDSALNILLFLLQAGPSTLLWLLLLFLPARWSWRKLRLVAAPKQSPAGAL